LLIARRLSVLADRTANRIGIARAHPERLAEVNQPNEDSLDAKPHVAASFRHCDEACCGRAALKLQRFDTRNPVLRH
jgi:hypothetical protein